ncbi:family 16 glycoside hydrolase [Leucosporidium creatinivorum]|uniref:Family 16 glycoside hydrolase n=1 Tax=Leucosporidium creatinivorum TaxID=106004 RepID=A0A1Y2DC13_9BASI|nr:family 16 glycoside hydrolase [Leucosporidium creatinivorum]
MHDFDPEIEKALDKQIPLWSTRGWFDAGFLAVIIIVIVGLFAGWPIWNYAIRGGFPNDIGARQDIGGWGPGGINGSGQAPSIPGLPLLVDKDTPDSARSRVGFDGETYNLVFSDEFNTDGRTFWPGDDPFWEAVDLHYWGTTDYEWYDPDAAITKNGNLEITLSQEPWHNLNFRSAMLQSWNKFCFTGGYIEVRASMPGTPDAMGFWPGAWTMGNLARAGYGATNHGVWPYTYNSCDVGTMPNQTWANGTGPAAALHSGDRDYGGILSYAPGQRLSACTCPGEDHPGPNVNVGRGAPEIDITESQIDWRGTGSTSQSIQFLPSDAGYAWKNSTPDTVIFNDNITFQNIWMGSVNQESASVITLTDDTSFDGAGYLSFAFEYDPGSNGEFFSLLGRITWAVNNAPSWEIHASAIGPNADTQIGQRLISEEPMSIILNLGISNSFQTPQWDKIRFPGILRIDYVRVYQKGDPQVGCDPPSHPTSDYINRHLEAYMNPNLTMWTETNNLTWPKNSLSEGGCA